MGKGCGITHKIPCLCGNCADTVGIREDETMAVNKPTKKATKTGKAIEVKFIPSDELISNRLYANYVQVTHSPFDFTLRFCDAPSILDVKKVIKDG